MRNTSFFYTYTTRAVEAQGVQEISGSRVVHCAGGGIEG
jgi:hypothetical protein